MIRIYIDGVECSGSEGQTILEIAAENGIEIPNLCHNGFLKHYAGCAMCVVEAEGGGKLLRACSTKASDGQRIYVDSPRAAASRKITMELLMSDHTGDCRGPCVLNCPAGTRCQDFIRQIATGNYRESVKILKETIPLPASVGRICPHPCEKACRRRLVEEPLSIANLQYFVSDKVREAGGFKPEAAPSTGKKVAVIGGGPGGLSAAFYLALKGHDVTVIEAMPKMGGMLRYGIPEYRLPKSVLDAEIEEIRDAGVKMVNNVRAGVSISMDELRKMYDALIVAIGAWKSSSLNCPGEELKGVYGGIDFLRAVACGETPEIGEKVAVVGGGNTAMDACRTAVRLGAKKVYVIYRRTEDEMPAEKSEIKESREEGVEYKFLMSPAEITGENGRVRRLILQVMEPGEPDASGRRSPVPAEGRTETLEVDSVISAIGQKAELKGFEDLELNRRGNIKADECTFMTSEDGIFAIGDVTNRGSSIAIEAVGEAGRCAEAADSYLKGELKGCRKPFVSEKEVAAEDLADWGRIDRKIMPVRPAEERKKDFTEVNLGFSDEQARMEAWRCLRCGCADYDECRLIRYANRDEIHPERFKGAKHPAFTEDRLKAVTRDQGKCILCGQCVRICDEVVGKGFLGLAGRGFNTVIRPEFKDSAVTRFCADCHRCADSCPTGALMISEY